ncbi:MAG: four helix bundle protein [Planctomycetales bacterium]|nr:four helix bundle protein [Planctomycetales bacterium]
MAVQDFRQLEVWQEAMNLVTAVYQYSKVFPKEETYGLTNQLHRAAVSIPSNIAEGQGRRSTKEFLNFLSVARGSLLEVQTQTEIAKRLKYLAEAETKLLEQQAGTVIRLLNGLIRALERKLE